MQPLHKVRAANAVFKGHAASRYYLGLSAEELRGVPRALGVRGGGGDWTTSSIAAVDLDGISYAQGRFVVVGTSGTILQSTDPEALAAESSGTTEDLAAVAYGADTWVAVGADGEIVVSGDAEAWSPL